ncbi:hypothetical protein IQ13_4165 [Lacibacter cauensis]|uniref:Uncharacterized protein n=1 Tax=Lacibacter cauensis TaxID=510947 RepID=A0A562SAN2_9BACT|nr:hypothetical protein [Lacibacter cauensis]TWI77924.1 hypothetical protein IQ13_4165 [Lacibacter cauensis]
MEKQSPLLYPFAFKDNNAHSCSIEFPGCKSRYIAGIKASGDKKFLEAINKKFYLIYLPSDPSQNSILPYCMVSPAYSRQNKSWPSLPEGKINDHVGKGDE